MTSSFLHFQFDMLSPQGGGKISTTKFIYITIFTFILTLALQDLAVSLVVVPWRQTHFQIGWEWYLSGIWVVSVLPIVWGDSLVSRFHFYFHSWTLSFCKGKKRDKWKLFNRVVSGWCHWYRSLEVTGRRDRRISRCHSHNSPSPSLFNREISEEIRLLCPPLFSF